MMVFIEKQSRRDNTVLRNIPGFDSGGFGRSRSDPKFVLFSKKYSPGYLGSTDVIRRDERSPSSLLQYVTKTHHNALTIITGGCLVCLYLLE